MDTREAILERMMALLGTVSGLKKVRRNRVQLVEEDRPGAMLLDGDERTISDNADKHRRAPAPVWVSMHPEIYFALPMPKPVAGGANIGTQLNAFRAKILHAIMTDPVLDDLLGQGGSITYVSGQTDLMRGRDNIGEMGLAFKIVYALYPTKLT